MFQLMMSLDRSAGSGANGLGWIRSSTQVQYQADVCAAVYFGTARHGRARPGATVRAIPLRTCLAVTVIR